MTDTVTHAVHPHADELINPDGSWKYTNSLSDQTSPYLLQHAHNPVDWHAWGPRAFELASERDVPIFLSIGYSTCYWCHVMERQVFENPQIAQQMNQQFVCIKVDREERPDVDDIYMTATQIMTRSGGWPMSVFLTPPGVHGKDDPGLKPFWAGTYLPPTPQLGRPSFPQVLQALSDAWKDQRPDVIQQAEQLVAAVAQALSQKSEPATVNPESIRESTDQLLRMYDHEHGGFGSAPKFPQPTYLDFLLRVYHNNRSDSLWQLIGHTLQQMAYGGMYDQIGGGFHRYSTDERWLVPHFEKMLYDNGQLVEVYARALALKPDDASAALYERIIRETCDYVQREMTDATGAFWSAQDAEVNAREGGSYIWTEQQVREAIGDPELAELALHMYGLTLGANFQDPHDPSAEQANVLYLPKPLAALAAEIGIDVESLLAKRLEINQSLKAARDKREQPGTDDKVLVSWNGMMIAAFAEAGRVLGESAYVDAAGKAADAIHKHMVDDDGGLYRTMRNKDARIPAYLEDYAWYVHGLLALHRAQSNEPKWLELARHFTDIAIDRFTAEHGGYYDTLADQQDLFVRVRGTYDGAVPSANGRMIHNLITLYELTDDSAWLDRAHRDLESFAEALSRNGAAMVQMQGALLRAINVDSDRFTNALKDPQPQTTDKPVVASVSPEICINDGIAEFAVTLRIQDGYHINSHEPSEPDLIPTSIELKGAADYSLSVTFPLPQMQRFNYADQPLSVFTGSVTINARLERRTGHESELPTDAVLELSYQACTDQACMTPVTERLPLAIKGEAY